MQGRVEGNPSRACAVNERRDSRRLTGAGALRAPRRFIARPGASSSLRRQRRHNHYRRFPRHRTTTAMSRFHDPTRVRTGHGGSGPRAGTEAAPLRAKGRRSDPDVQNDPPREPRAQGEARTVRCTLRARTPRTPRAERVELCSGGHRRSSPRLVHGAGVPRTFRHHFVFSAADPLLSVTGLTRDFSR